MFILTLVSIILVAQRARITCLLAIDLFRIKKARPREDLALEEVIARKLITPVTAEIYPDVHGALLKSRPRVRAETFQNLRKSREPQLGSQQHRYGRSDRTTRRTLKRLKTRSIAGASYELEDNQLNELTKPIPEVHNKGSVRIEPVLRVTTKNNVFDSIMDILRQLLNPSKNEPGPLVGPIQVPGSARKIYLRLLEPVDANHVMVRFVTQVPVPVIDVESKYSFPHGPPIVDPTALLLSHHHGHHDAAPSIGDPIFDASTRHNSIHPPQNASRASDKTRGGSHSSKESFPKTLKNPSKDYRDIGTSGKGDFSLDKGAASSDTESNSGKTMTVVEAPLNLQSHEDLTSQFPGESIDSYYPYHTVEENAAKRLKGSVNSTASNIGHDVSKESPPPAWHQLSTHRLPLRQIAPIYSLTSAAPDELADSYASTYDETLSSDVLVVPSLYETSSYERYNKDNMGNTAAELHTGSYDQHHTAAPISYPTTLRDASSSFYSVSFDQKQNEFGNDALNSYAHTGYEKPSDSFFGASSPHASSYKKPVDVASTIRTTIHDKRNDQPAKVASSSSNDALRVIDPPYFSVASSLHSQPSKSHIEPFVETIRQPRYNSHSHLNEVSSNVRLPVGDILLDQTIWGKTKREKNSDSSLRQDAGSSDNAGNREKWQPIMYVDEKGIWQVGEPNLFTDLTMVDAGGRRETGETYDRSRKAATKDSRNLTNSVAGGGDRRQGIGKRRDAVPSAVRAMACSSTSDRESKRCEERVRSPTKLRTISTEQQNVEPVMIIAATTSTARASSTPRTPEATTRSPTTSTMMNIIVTARDGEPLPLLLPLTQTTESPAASSTTERSSLSIKMIKSVAAVTNDTIERPIANETKMTGGGKETKSGPTTENTVDKSTTKSTMDRSATKSTTDKSATKSTTDRSATKSTTDRSATKSTTRKTLTSSDNPKKSSMLLKRPMVMKNAALVMKRIESGDTTKSTTQKPLTSNSTTKRPPTTTTTTTRTFRGENPRKKSST